MYLHRLLSATILVLIIHVSYGQPNSDLKEALLIKPLTQAVNFDGIPDEEAWESADPIDLIMFSPNWGKEPSEKSDIRFGYDEKYLYVGAKLYYEDPSMIRSASYKRDYEGMGGDWFGFILDTYNDKENAVVFFTTPDGLRFDGSIQADATVRSPNQMPMNLSWNTFWDVETETGPEGWSAEIRIPLSSIRFQDIDEEVRMGLIIQRWIPAKNEMNLFPAIPPNWGETSSMKPSQAQEIILHGVESHKPLYIAPYALGGYESSYDLSDDESQYLRSDDPVIEAGLDVKYGLTSNLILDLTANTDFAQVEADDQQVNLTRYSLYFPEKRLFFLERASVFDFTTGRNDNLFYSRRIGLSDDGDPVRIYGGARLTGRLNKWDVGFLDMQTAPLRQKNESGTVNEILPSENFGVIRLRRQIINDNTYIGAIATSRLGADGSYNLAYGVDGIFRVFGDDYLDIKWSQTFDDTVSNSSVKEPTLFTVTWERRSRIGLGYELGYMQSGIHFNPGMGFEMLNDYTALSGRLGYGWLADEESKLYSYTLNTRMFYRTYIDDGSLMSITSFSGLEFVTKNQWMLDINLIYNNENLREELWLSDDLIIPPGDYRYLNSRISIVTPMSRPLYSRNMIMVGQYYDGVYLSVRAMPTWNISKHLELGGTYNFNYVDVSKRNVTWINHLVGAKALFMLNTKLSVNAFIQYNKSVHEIITNVRIRYNPKEGNDLYLVYNEGRNTELTRETPELPVYYCRAFMVKYTYTFNL